MKYGERMEDFDQLVEELERQIREEERALYSAEVIEHSHNPRNLKKLDRFHAHAVVHGWCGDTMEIYLRLERMGRIREATFFTDGCGPSVACGSMLTCMVRGKPSKKALQISAQDLIAALGGLPEESVHCAELAVKTLRAAISRRNTSDSG